MTGRRPVERGPQTTRRLAQSLLPAALLVLALSATVRAERPAWFRDVAAALGLPAARSTRNVWADLDGDGWPDAVLARARVFRNRPAAPAGTPRFVELPDSGLAAPCGSDGKPADLLLFADFNNDGRLDAFAGRFQEVDKPGAVISSNAILLGGKDGRLHPRASSGVEALRDPLIAGVVLDADLDGHADIFTGSSYRVYGKSLEAAGNRLLLGDGRGAFRDATAELGLACVTEPGRPDSRRPTYGVTSFDWNNDGRPDILTCAYGRQWNRLWENRPTGFVDRGPASGVDGDSDRSGRYPEWTKRMWKQRFGHERRDEAPFRSNGNTFDAPAGDFDNDGDLDLFLGEITHSWAGPASDLSAVLENRGDGEARRFKRRPELIPRPPRTGRWNQGDLHGAWHDFNNDGRLDLLIASTDYPDGQFLSLAMQQPDGRFVDRTVAAGLLLENAAQPSVADFDGDGDLDILVGNSHMRLPKALREANPQRVALFENRIGARRAWLTVRLVGAGGEDGAAKLPFGARVTVTCALGTLTRELQSSLGHAGHSDFPELHFGLGDCETIESITVRWPNAARSTSRFTTLPTRRHLILTEGETTPEIHPRRPVPAR